MLLVREPEFSPHALMPDPVKLQNPFILPRPITSSSGPCLTPGV